MGTMAVSYEGDDVHGPWNRKPFVVVANTGIFSGPLTSTLGDGGGGDEDEDEDENNNNNNDANKFSLFDLISIGVGGTIGSGIFVLTGFVAHAYAGPATFLSFMLSGFAAMMSAPSYAEFASQLPTMNGSTYAFCFVSLGEYAAVIAGACLTLEYGVSGAAVARSWGDKVSEWISSSLEEQELEQEEERAYSTQTTPTITEAEETAAVFNPLAGAVTLIATMVLAYGVQESKRVTHFFTILKVVLVIFMIVGGFVLFKIENMDVPPLIKPELGGFDGVLRGATSSFFGYLGFDQVCCMAADAKHPGDPSKAALWTLAIVTTIYILASVALTGMLPYEEISDTSGFPLAFEARGVTWAAKVTALGEVVTLPVVVLISLLAQPRLFAAMAQDGLLPSIFARQTASGNLFWSSVLCGLPMSLLAAFVPFSFLDDAISVGILVAFNMTNTSLILMKCKDRRTDSVRNSKSSTMGSYDYRDTDGGVEMIHVGRDKEIRHSLSDPNASSSTDTLQPRRRSAPVEPSSSSSTVPSHPHTLKDTIVDSGIFVDRDHGTTTIRNHSRSLSIHLIIFHILAFCSGLTSHLTRSETTSSTATESELSNSNSSGSSDAASWEGFAQIGSMLLVILYALYIHRRFPNTGRFGNNNNADNNKTNSYRRHNSDDVSSDDDIIADGNSSGLTDGRHDNLAVDRKMIQHRKREDAVVYIDDEDIHNDSNNKSEEDGAENHGRSFPYGCSSQSYVYVPFEAPLVPLLPLMGNFLNWYLIAQLDKNGIFLLLLFLGVISLLYIGFINGRPKSKDPTSSTHAQDWKRKQQQQHDSTYYHPVHHQEDHDEDDQQ